MPPTPFPNRHFSPPADNLDWGGWDETNQKESEMMTPEKFLKRFYPAGFPISPEQWEKDVPEIMESYAEHCQEIQWISVDERLPEIGQFCIVYQPIGAYDGRPIFSCGFHSIDAGIWPNITHWRPLPTPPKQ